MTANLLSFLSNLNDMLSAWSRSPGDLPVSCVDSTVSTVHFEIQTELNFQIEYRMNRFSDFEAVALDKNFSDCGKRTSTVNSFR